MRGEGIVRQKEGDGSSLLCIFQVVSAEEFGVVVIGGGSGGYSAASELAGLGVRTALIEKAQRLGGLCILRGCMPSKTLIESANLFRRMRNSAEFGIYGGTLRLEMKEVQKRKRRIVEGFQEYREEQMREGGFELIRGRARFVGGKRIQIGSGDTEREISFRFAVVATGSKPKVPDIEGLGEVGYWLSRDALEADEVPEHLIVIGGGAIGCEMAHCFEGFGAKVTVVQRSGCLLPEFEKEISSVMTRVSEKRGITVHCDSSTRKVRNTSDGKIEIELEKGGKMIRIEGDRLLVAVGRVPATEDLGLDQIGVELDDRAIVVDERNESSVEGIFAVGDVCGKLPVVHEAVIEGEDVVRVIAERLGKLSTKTVRVGPKHSLFGIFTHPECARAGMGPKELEGCGSDMIEARYDFSDHGKAEILDEMDGFVKLVAGKSSGKILAATVIGPDAINLIHEIQIAIHAGMTVAELAEIPHYHPTLSEIWTYPAEELKDKLEKKI